MVEYLDWKDASGVEDSALVFDRFAKQKLECALNVYFRKIVHLPSALELSKADQSCLGSGEPDYLGFLGKFFAKQLSEVNKKNTWVKHGLARWSTHADTIPFQKKTSEMIRFYNRIKTELRSCYQG